MGYGVQNHFEPSSLIYSTARHSNRSKVLSLCFKTILHCSGKLYSTHL